MKPGEFEYTILRRSVDHPDWNEVTPDSPDFPAAVVALQSLLPKPSVHPAVGLRYCGEEEAFDWAAGDDRFRYEDGVIKWWTPIARGGDGRKREAPMLHCFNAGREYERRQG